MPTDFGFIGKLNDTFPFGPSEKIDTLSPSYPIDRFERPVEYLRRVDGGTATLRPLEPYVRSGEIYIANGKIRFLEYTPNIGGTLISNDPAPSLTPPSGTSYVHLKITFKPRTVLLDTGYYGMGFDIASITNAEFISSADTALSLGGTDPVINTATGNVTTDGIAHIQWATIISDVDGVRLGGITGTGYVTLLFHPPDRLLVFQN